MRPRTKSKRNSEEGFAAFAPIEALQIMLILITGLITCMTLWVAIIAGLYGVIAGSDPALATAETAFQTGAVTAFGLGGLIWSYRFARRPASPKS
jgi:hypothetical protein|tara:strand:- start:290 stop:574 length:285 start_codon:yes stop_codon:yes gene_type:complete